MLSLFFIILAGFCNAIMDTIQFRYDRSIFNKYFEKWSNPILSWKNKWKNGNREEGERFIGSSTFFVWTTDLWHFAQSFMITFFCIAAICYSPIFSIFNNFLDLILDLAILKIAFSLSFEFCWSILFKKNGTSI